MQRKQPKRWNVALTAEDLAVARRVFADYMTQQLAIEDFDKQRQRWLRDVDRVQRIVQHTGPRD